VNRRALQEKYPFIRAFVQTDCKPNTKNGRVELIKEIESAIGGMEHVRAAFPADWFRIKERLAEMKEPFISFESIGRFARNSARRMHRRRSGWRVSWMIWASR
jgi:hypothetical protein